jgi:hypothetical protein
MRADLAALIGEGGMIPFFVNRTVELFVELKTQVVRLATEMSTRVIQLVLSLRTRAIQLLQALRSQAISIVTDMVNQIIQLVAGMVQSVLDSLIELRDESGEILEDIAEIFEEMGKRIAQAVVGITSEIDKLIGKLEDLIDKAHEAMDAMQDAGIMGESPSRFETSLRGIAQAMSDLPSLTAEWTRTLNVQPMPAPVAAGGGTSVYLMVDRFEFPSIRSARDAGDFMRELQTMTEKAKAKGNVPGGVG